VGAEADPFVREYVEWGAGPRASQYLTLGAKALALLHGKPSPSTVEVRTVAPSVLQHRVIPNYKATGEGISSLQIVERLLKTAKEPDYRGK
jgi:MoxR-like ATPase